uniref:Uncharacterized protein n=1 Tax=Globisporangium ultimum (strain ATCC 200006 / CBS 805.95 / DAOM BR144) TaxID=431595 RepID=K3WYL9_GLOUD
MRDFAVLVILKFATMNFRTWRQRLQVGTFFSPVYWIGSSVKGSPAVKSASSMTNRVTRVDDAADNSGRLGPNRTNLSFAPDSNHRRLFRVKVENSHIGVTFLDVFLEYLRLEMLVIGILRSPNPALENLLPFVYTCPDPDTILHAKDRLFVLG